MAKSLSLPRSKKFVHHITFFVRHCRCHVGVVLPINFRSCSAVSEIELKKPVLWKIQYKFNYQNQFEIPIIKTSLINCHHGIATNTIKHNKLGIIFTIQSAGWDFSTSLSTCPTSPLVPVAPDAPSVFCALQFQVWCKSEACNNKKLTFNSMYILHSDGQRVWNPECPLWPHDRAILALCLHQSQYL